MGAEQIENVSMDPMKKDPSVDQLRVILVARAMLWVQELLQILESYYQPVI